MRQSHNPIFWITLLIPLSSFANHPAICKIDYFTATPSTIVVNDSSQLDWGTTYCYTASISNIGGVPVDGSQSTGPLSTTQTYVLTATGSGTETATAIVNVVQPSVCSIYVMGGEGYNGVLKKDVWTTTNGVNWTQLPNALWSKRGDYSAVVFNDGTGEKIYLTGGRSTNFTYHHDVWTFDGTTWTQITTAPWTKRNMHMSVVFNDGMGEKMYLMGGRSNSGDLNDVWSSPDGINWTQVSANAPWSKRTEFGAVVYNDGNGSKIYVMGGFSNGSYLHDVWSSSDGVNWTQLPNAPWSERGDFTPVVFNDGTGDRIYVLGGNGNITDDVWSFDGSTWTQEVVNTAWGDRIEPGTVSFDAGSGEQLFMMGGFDWGLQKDVWTTSNGVNWTQLPDAAWVKRYDFTPVVYCN